MRFKAKLQKQELPEINLVPMMDVLMTILVFFIIISMTAEFNQAAVDVNLPVTETGSNAVDAPEPLVVTMDLQGQVFVREQLVEQSQLTQPVQDYLAENPEGVVVLKADQQLTYQQIVEVLGPLRDVGGDRVSLAVEP